MMMQPELKPEKGLLFRITHRANLRWLLAHGVSCPNGASRDPNFVAIGNADLIACRARHHAPIPPGGTLADYVPFYFTPKSPMLLNIKTGYHGVTIRENAEIVILVSSCQTMAKKGVDMLFTDRHAYAATAYWTADQAELASMIDWDILNRSDFARDEAYPDKRDRYQAEALAHHHVPPSALIGVGCVHDKQRSTIEDDVAAAGLDLRVVARPHWYF